MTFAAIGFDVRVALDDFPGHDDGLEINRACDPAPVKNGNYGRYEQCSQQHTQQCLQYMCTASTCTSAELTIMTKNGT